MNQPFSFVTKYEAERAAGRVAVAAKNPRPLIVSPLGCQCPHCGRFIELGEKPKDAA